MSTNHPLVFLLAATTAVAFVLAIIGSDAGASQAVIIHALCAVAVLGASTVTAATQLRRP